MAPLPKRRHSTRRQGKRQHALIRRDITISKCKRCGAAKLPHQVCPECGFYTESVQVTIAPKRKI